MPNNPETCTLLKVKWLNLGKQENKETMILSIPAENFKWIQLK